MVKTDCFRRILFFSQPEGACRFEQIEGSDNIGLNKLARVMNRTIHM